MASIRSSVISFFKSLNFSKHIPFLLLSVWKYVATYLFSSIKPAYILASLNNIGTIQAESMAKDYGEIISGLLSLRSQIAFKLIHPTCYPSGVNDMSFCISSRSPTILPCIDLRDFKPSCITVIEGSSSLVPDVLFRLCAASVVSLERDAILVDGGNSFNPYSLSRIAKSFGAQPRKVLSRIHVARAFTEYQMEALIHGLPDALQQWNPAVLAISYLPSLFSGSDGMRLFGPLLENLKLLMASSDVITAITSFGGSWYGDRLLASRADRVIRIEQPSKKLIRLFDNGHVFDYVPVPPGQMRFTDFTGGEYGQNSAQLPNVA
jgi:hypothetical protein